MKNRTDIPNFGFPHQGSFESGSPALRVRPVETHGFVITAQPSHTVVGARNSCKCL